MQPVIINFFSAASHHQHWQLQTRPAKREAASSTGDPTSGRMRARLLQENDHRRVLSPDIHARRGAETSQVGNPDFDADRVPAGLGHHRRWRCSGHVSSGPAAEARIGQTSRILHPRRNVCPGHSERPRKSSRNFYFEASCWRTGRKYRPARCQRRSTRGQRDRGCRKDVGPGDGHDGRKLHQSDCHGQAC